MQIVDLDDASGPDQFADLLRSNRPVHRIGSGLGNQLFAVSEVANHQAFDAILDVRDAQHTQFMTPDQWLPSLPALQDCIVVKGGRDLQWCPTDQWHDLGAGDARGRFRTGWRPSVAQVRRAGLFPRGSNPFDTAASAAQTTSQQNVLGVHVRRARELRYRFATIGELDMNAYRQMLRLVPREDIDRVSLATSGPVPNALRRLLDHYGPVQKLPAHPLDTLNSLARSRYLVTANSTFSWWAGWFCSGTVIMPTPWYIRDRSFDSDLCPPDWHSVKRSDLWLFERSVRYQYQRVRWGLRRRIHGADAD